MTYAEFICTRLEGFPVGQPIYTGDIAVKLAEEYKLSAKEAAAATAVAFKRIMENEQQPNLRFYQKGIYYCTARTPFGEVGINKERLIADKYLLPDNGYETGFAILHRMGLTSQIPRERCFATNKVSDCARMDTKLGIMVRPPKTRINGENKAYLQFLDALDLMDKAPVDAEQPYALLANYIKRAELKYEHLLALADRYYNKKTILQLAHTAGEGGLQ